MKRSIVLGSAVAAAFLAGAAQADVTVYNRAHFNGPSMTLRGEARDLEGSGFYDSISSIQVHDGQWQFCSQPNFGGDCAVLGPGNYATLGRELNHRIESVRPIGIAPRPSRAEIELFSAPGFRGRSAALNRDAWSLERRGFDQRASSVVVNEGRWELCTEPGFRGRCRVYGPGEYTRLGPRMDDQVSSLRRVG